MKKEYHLLLFHPLLLFMLVVYAYTRGCHDEYLTIAVPIFVFMEIATLIAIFLHGDMRFTMSCLLLLHIGGLAQVMIGEKYREYILHWYVALAAALIFCFGMKYFKKKSHSLQCILLVCGIVFCYVLLLVAGKTVNNTKAWIEIGKLSLQVTDVSKLFTVFLLGNILSNQKLSQKRKFFYLILTLGINTLGLICVNEMGTLAIVILEIFMVTFVFLDKKYSILTAIVGFCGALAGAGLLWGSNYLLDKMIVSKGYKMYRILEIFQAIWRKITNRFDLFISLEKHDAYGYAYQAKLSQKVMSLTEFLGNSYKIKIPVEESDYIFVSILSRMGLLIAIIVIVLFISLLFSGTDIAFKNRNQQEHVTGYALSFMIVIQALLNILGTTNAFVLLGIPIPFLSTGGTSMVVSMIALVYMNYISGNTTEKRKGESPCQIKRHLNEEQL